MRIAKVEAFAAPLPLRKPFAIALGTMTRSPNVVVRVETDQGTVGYGEAATWHVVYGYDQASLIRAIDRHLGPAVLGMDPLDLRGVLDRMDAALPENHMAKAGIETACQDLRGKAAGLPLCQLLGGPLPESVEVIAAVDIVPPAEAEALAAQWLGMGFGCLKIKVGLDLRADVERVAVVRRTVGPGVRLRVDGNQGYDRATAVKACKAFEPFDLQWFEQPLPSWDFEGLAALVGLARLPIALDESIEGPRDVYRAAAARAADVINIKIAKCGGISPSLKVAHAAEAAGLPCFLGGNLETGVGVAIALHFAAACPNLAPAVEIPGSQVFADDIVDRPFAPAGGRLALPSGPGIGVRVDEEKLRRYGGAPGA